VRTLPDRPLVHRLVRGQGWIVLLGFLLMGIVAMQVSLLKLNAGIGRDVERAASLQRRNGELRAEVSRLSSGERIQAKAAELGMVMPPAGAVTYLRGGRGGDVPGAVGALRAGRFAPGAPTSPPPGLPADAPGGTATEAAETTGTESAGAESTATTPTPTTTTTTTTGESAPSGGEGTQSTPAPGRAGALEAAPAGSSPTGASPAGEAATGGGTAG
jgi:cell division protein FtsL